MSLPSLRKRRAVTPVAGLRSILSGVFGTATPNSRMVDQVQNSGSLYHFHEGDVFTPGTANYALDPSFETPLQTVWGHGVMAPLNVLSPIHPGLVVIFPAAIPTGIGGQIAGQLLSQPLSDPEDEIQ